VPTGGVQSNTYSPSGPTADPSWPQLYPKVLKIEERRVPIGDQNISPYCIQNYVNADGTYQPILNSTNQPVTIFLNETEPTTVEPLTSKRTLFASLEERGGDLFERQSSSTCGCVWLAQWSEFTGSRSWVEIQCTWFLWSRRWKGALVYSSNWVFYTGRMVPLMLKGEYHVDGVRRKLGGWHAFTMLMHLCQSSYLWNVKLLKNNSERYVIWPWCAPIQSDKELTSNPWG